MQNNQPPQHNVLGSETSPYLRQHKDNPVFWQPWRSDILALAQSLDRPILLSVGYSACHWCHVMAHESFESPVIADVMNRHFINIKVDREERPDLDMIYQRALASLGQPGGWPLTMFLTPTGAPFWGGTYFPPESRWGRPGFPDVLETVARLYKDAPDKIAHNVESLSAALASERKPAAGPYPDPDLQDRCAKALIQYVDLEHGGLGGAPKFPQTSVFDFLWRAAQRGQTPGADQAVRVSLLNMCQGGIYDHLGGGFARYATDDRWLIPHFEKMLYDNAQLIELLSHIAQQDPNPLYEQRVEETIDWLLREMTIADPEESELVAFASALDADSEGEEGKYYVWSYEHIRDSLNDDDFTLFASIYDVGPGGNWEGVTILNRLEHLDLLSKDKEARLAHCRSTLLAIRADRIPPGRDDKVITEWNALLISGLVRAAGVFGHREWLTLAETCLAFINRNLKNPTDGSLLRTWCQGRAQNAAILDDYANLAKACLDLWCATGKSDYLDQCQNLVTYLDDQFWDHAMGGYFYTAENQDDLITRPKTAFDNAVPSGNGVLVGTLFRLSQATGEPRYQDRAAAIVSAFSGDIARNFTALPTLMNGALVPLNGHQIVIITGDAHSSETQRWRDAAQKHVQADGIVQVIPRGQDLPSLHPASGKTNATPALPAAFICVGTTCYAPVTTLTGMVDSLRALSPNAP